MSYEWDEGKRRSNLRKHGLDFRDAYLAFTESAVVLLDERYDCWMNATNMTRSGTYCMAELLINWWQLLSPIEGKLCASFPCGKRAERKKGSMSKTDWGKVEQMTDEEIDFSDIPPATSEQMAKAVPLGRLFPELVQRQNVVALDDDVAEWAKQQSTARQADFAQVVNRFFANISSSRNHWKIPCDG